MKFLAFLLLAGIPAIAEAAWSRVDAPGGKLDFDAYSVIAPMEKGWMVNRAGPYDVGFGAMLSKTYTWSLTATAIPLPDGLAAPQLLAHAKAQFLDGSDPKRFVIVETRESFEELRGAMCARTYYKAEDRLASGGPAAAYMIEATQLTCVHPSEPRLAIEIGYHERYQPGEKTGSARLDLFGERFIKSVRFWRPVGGASAGR